jgi:propionyl-CoA carboxylase alpha chain
MAGMGDKLQSKVIAEQAGVTTIPGYDGNVESVEHALKIANDIGYPILLKAVAGGGGKGMRTCMNDRDVEEAYRMSKAEAKVRGGEERCIFVYLFAL